ncbi:AI-2E family transporter [Nocardioides aestuarii]|uniref:AI-2E family transporter n=1 Tax=Nocardioides aestuarii TaxID=252231 RepID=A0ABW4TKX2_9ACTN
MSEEGDGQQPEEGRQRFGERIAHQWATVRAERQQARSPEPFPAQGGVTNLRKAEVPHGVDLAAAWSWRLLVIAGAGWLLLWLVSFFAVLAVPVAIALLGTALVSPLVRRMTEGRVPRPLAAGVVVLGGLVSIGLLLTFVGSQVAAGASDLADSVVQGIGQVKDWLKTGPLNASDSQINDVLGQVQETITSTTAEGGVLTRTLEVGTALGHVVAGFFIVLFSTYFFLADGEKIWAWLVRIAPRVARERVDSSGRVAWRSLTQFVRATVVVAAVDALGVMLVAKILGVPFVLAIGVLVFLGAFVPVIGATIASTVAILVALVDQGPIDALLMLAGVIVVQQIEGHVLQPFLMGRFVSVHPLGVILALGAGVLVAGVIGALVAVPLAAALNAVVVHLASGAPGVVASGPDVGTVPVHDPPGGVAGDRPADA